MEEEALLPVSLQEARQARFRDNRLSHIRADKQCPLEGFMVWGLEGRMAKMITKHSCYSSNSSSSSSSTSSSSWPRMGNMEVRRVF